MSVQSQQAPRNRSFGNGGNRQAPAPRPAGPVTGEVVDMAPVSGGAVEAITRGEIDIQIRTAKFYPRDIPTVLQRMEALATRDVETAESCSYTLKRKDRDEPGGFKKIQGPSIRFAEILVACWGHMRIAGVTLAEDERFVTLRGMAWDLESNSAFSVDVKRRITTRQGHTYSDDMIGVTTNAGISIGTRNAILHVIPGAFWKPVWEKCQVVARGDAKTLMARWVRVLEFFQKQYGKSAEDIYGYLDIRGEADVTLDHLEEMQGLRTALKDGETTVDEAFADVTPTTKPADPATAIATEIGCSAAEATAILAGFEVLGIAPPARQIQLKKHKGNAAGLLQLLRDMSGQELAVEGAAPAATQATAPAASTSAPSSDANASTAATPTAPAATGAPTQAPAVKASDIGFNF